MQQEILNIPTEVIPLPSKGYLYPENSPLAKGEIEMKYMTAREEDILTNKNYIQKGTVFDHLLKSLIVTEINYDELFEGDKSALLIAARILSYGKDYTFTYNGKEVTVDLTTLKEKDIDHESLKGTNNQFNFQLPNSGKTVTFKLLTHGDERKIEEEVKGLKKMNPKFSGEGLIRLKHMVTSVNGEDDPATVRAFVESQFLAMDARAFRKHYNEISPDIDLTTTIEDEDGEEEVVNVPLGINFFWPDL
jgi:hypothetical protein